MEPTQEKVPYLGPSWIDHGRWIEREDGSKALTRIVISTWVEPPSDQRWTALKDQLNPVEQRRRLREKTAVKAFELMAEGEGDEEMEEREGQQMIQRVIEEEMTTAMFDHHEVLEEIFEEILGGVAWLKEAIVEEKKTRDFAEKNCQSGRSQKECPRVGSSDQNRDGRFVSCQASIESRA